ncbi:hypothetical protein BCV72DRAFT_324583 [Rhizopus microsporus var. microsporus]|uniref:Uncharacterized protein n=1 Tax=Rhizopus microsporus var. microsporus TaxID=86635 RepID=A0A1X0RIB7_RHIZD|nr:hypothetical protein BCV72DRAFT_324583 [Rhizopus microsporus var. microsporus]
MLQDDNRMESGWELIFKRIACSSRKPNLILIKYRSRVWSVNDTPAQVKVPTQKDINLSIVECIFHLGPLTSPNDVAKIQKEFPLPENKKRKVKIGESSKTKVKKGTTAYHVVTFVRNIMGILDRHDKKGFFYRHR